MDTNEGASNHPTLIYLFKVRNGNTKIMCGICSKLTTKIYRNDVIDVVLVSSMSTLNGY